MTDGFLSARLTATRPRLVEQGRHWRSAARRLGAALFGCSSLVAPPRIMGPDLTIAGKNPVLYARSVIRWLWRRAPFDAEYYLAANPDVAAHGVDPQAHFARFGIAEGRSPHPLYGLRRMAWRLRQRPLFDPDYYLATNPDVAAGGSDPYTHFVHFGATEGRNPHPLFDVRHYLAGKPDLSAADGDPLLHYLTQGWREGRDPHPLFDGQYYLHANPDVAKAGINPLLHYLTQGWREGRDPHPCFQSSVYRRLYPDVAASDCAPLLHYVRWGKAEKRTPGWIVPPEELPRLADPLDLLPMALPLPPEPLVSIIIPMHGQPELTMRCLHGLSRHRTAHPFETILVDDGSDAATREALARVEGLRVLRLDPSRGFVAACNAGAERARGRYLLFLNNDTYVQPGWLDELVGAFDLLPEAGAVGSALIYPGGRLQEAGALVWNDATAQNIGRQQDRNAPAYSFAREVDYCSGASLMIPAELFARLGGFDPRYAPGYYEDTDLCLRVRQAGYKVYCQPLSMLVHVEGGTAGTDTAQGMKRFQPVNRAKFAARWARELERAPAPGAFDAERFRRPGQRRLLVIDHALPSVDQDAGSVVIVELMRLFARLGYAVVFGALRHPQERDERVRALERLGIEVVRAPYYGAATDYLAEHQGSIDVVLMVRYPVAQQVLAHVAGLARRPRTLLLNADLHYLRAERQAALYADPDLARQAAREKQVELAVVRGVDLTITHSDYERELLRLEAPGRLVETLPWIVRPAEAVPPFEARRDVLFVGGFEHAPNVDAMVHFVLHVWPALRRALPDAGLRIVGSRAGAAIRPLAGHGVEVVGHVADLRAELDRARVAIAPLRWGAGFKGKVASSLAAGLPTVASPVAAEGMGLADGESCLLAEPGPAFAAAVARLYEDGALWRRLSAGGLALAQAQWSPAQAEARLIRILHRARIAPTFTLSDRIEAEARRVQRHAA